MRYKFNVNKAVRKRIAVSLTSHESSVNSKETETNEEIKTNSINSSNLNENISRLEIEMTGKKSQSIENKFENITFISEEINQVTENNINLEHNIEEVNPYVLRFDNKFEEMSELDASLSDDISVESTRITMNTSQPDVMRAVCRNNNSLQESTKSQQKHSENVSESQEQQPEEPVEPQQEQTIEEPSVKSPINTKAYKPKFNAKGAFSKEKSKTNQNKPTESPDAAMKSNNSTQESIQFRQKDSESISKSQEQPEKSVETSYFPVEPQQEQTTEEPPVKSPINTKAYKPKFNAKGAFSKEKSKTNQNKPTESPDAAMKSNNSTQESTTSQQKDSESISKSQEQPEKSVETSYFPVEPQQEQTIEEPSVKSPINTKAYKPKFNAKGAFSKEKSKTNQNKPTESPDAAMKSNNSTQESIQFRQKDSERIPESQEKQQEEPVASLETPGFVEHQQEQTIEEPAVKTPSNMKAYKPKFNTKGAFSKEKSKSNPNKPTESPGAAMKSNNSTQEKDSENISKLQEEQPKKSVETSDLPVEPQQEQTIEEPPVKSPTNTKAYKPKFNAKGAFSKDKSKSNPNKPTESPGADKTRLESTIKTRTGVRNSVSESSNNPDTRMDCDVEGNNEEPVASTIRNETGIDNSAAAVILSDDLANKSELDQSIRQIGACSSVSRSLRSNSPELSLGNSLVTTSGDNQLALSGDNVSVCGGSKLSRGRIRAPVLLHSQPQETNVAPIDMNNIKLKDILNADIRYPPQRYRLERKNNNKTKRNKQSSTEIVEDDTPSDSNHLNVPLPREQRFRLDLNGQIVLDEEEDTENQQGDMISRERDNMEEVVEYAGELQTTYRSYTKRKLSGKRWQPEETFNFYRALMALGTNFTAMASVFAGRSRADLKKKFKVEEKRNLKFIEHILKNVRPWNITSLKFDSHVKKSIEHPRSDVGKRHLRGLDDDREEPIRKRRRFDKNSNKVDETANKVPDYLKTLCK